MCNKELGNTSHWLDSDSMELAIGLTKQFNDSFIC